jgi:hypothetical protein
VNSSLLRLTLAASIIATSLPSISYGEGYIWEEIGTDLYRKVDASFGKTNTILASKRIVGSNIRMNAVIRSKCGSSDWDFLKVGQDFTQEELEQMSQNSLSPIFSRMTVPLGKDGMSVNTDLLNCVQKVIKSDYSQVVLEAAQESKTLSSIGGLGLYTDGSTENSSFDLIKDLEQIHDIIFSKELPYTGSPNNSKNSVGAFFANPPRSIIEGLAQWASLTDRLSRDLADAGWQLPTPTKPTATGTVLDPACASGSSSLGGLDSNLLNDLYGQASFGKNGGSAIGGVDLEQYPLYGGSAAPIKWTTAGGNSMGSKNDGGNGFKCIGFFCIGVEFIQYNETLLGGSKTYSIQSILEQNFKIVTHFAGSSFTQAKHTNNFFELLLKNLDLPGMAHIGVVVTSLPAPILNLPGKDTPRWANGESEDKKEFTEMRTNLMKNYGVSIKNPNALPGIGDNNRDYGITLLDGLSTDFAEAKLKPARSFLSDYLPAKEAEIKNNYADSFAGDLVGLEAFTKAFVNHIRNFTSLVQKFDEIPQG